MTDTDWFAYVSFPTDCRCVAAVIVDEPEHAKDVAKWTADKIRRGFITERMRGDAFRKVPWRCPEHPDGRWPEKSKPRVEDVAPGQMPLPLGRVA